jgi:hypothetical protein
MKGLFLILFISTIVTTNSQAVSLTIQPTITYEIEQEEEKALPWGKIAASAGIVGVIMTFVPYLSIVGILLCGFALVAGIIGRKKRRNKRFATIGIWLGSLGLTAFLTVIGLIVFF